jgi:hypothetical protein
MARTQVQGDWVAIISALDSADNPTTLFFSDKGYKDSTTGQYYDSRMRQPARINVTGNDGGLLRVMQSKSVGEIILNNIDGKLNYLLDYAFDGREVTLQLIDTNGVVSTWFKGIVTRFYQQGNDLQLTLKSLSESLDLPLVQERYQGTGGVEGLATDIKGNVKPRVYGQVTNITPVLCFATSGIYQASDLNTCVIEAVYDKGVQMTLGVTRATLADLLANAPAANVYDRFQGYIRLGTMTVQQLTCDCTDRVSVGSATVAGLAGDVFNKICSTITFSTPRDIFGEIPVILDNPTHKYQLSASTTIKIIDVFDTGVKLVNEGEYSTLSDFNTIAPAKGKWRSFQGKIRITPKDDTQYPFAEVTLGVITCNAHDDAVVFTDTFPITVNSTAITTLNAVGLIGLYLNEDRTIRDTLDEICRSCAAYWWFGDSDNQLIYNINQINAKLYEEPSNTPDLTLHPYRTIGTSITRSATGVGENGLPYYSVLVRYGKIYTVQTDVLGATTQSRKALVAKDYLVEEQADLTVTKKRHPQSTRLEFQSLLVNQANAQTVATRMLNFFKKRCDVIDLTYVFSELPLLKLGMTIELFYPRFGYDAGVKMRLVSFETDVQQRTVTMRLIGYKV